MCGRMVCSSRYSRHIIRMDVRAMGWSSLCSLGHGFLGTRVIVAVFHGVGI